ncbi:MAG: carboxylating nicotinate-nucleotide diphosphorylase [candidate division Zixibacteria bacterium]|nr:carboxylating nicotinate-nucleotide diphosphorylase [candidate division Zixibacteria bacterium]
MIPKVDYDFVAWVLAEDLGKDEEDLTSWALGVPGKNAKAILWAKERGVLAGKKLFEAFFSYLELRSRFRWYAEDGDKVIPNMKVAEITACANVLLTAERSALNALCHLSGVATLTAQFVYALQGTGVRILDTRKTLPGLRAWEKYAVRVGGGKNHRIGLFDQILVKENHLTQVGSVAYAVKKSLVFLKKNYPSWKNDLKTKPLFEIEVKSQREMLLALNAGARFLMLDNFPLPELAGVVQKAREWEKKHTTKIWLEASGNVEMAMVRRVANTGVDFISAGALTHSAPALDFSLKIVK